jgi:hypothetical protein
MHDAIRLHNVDNAFAPPNADLPKQLNTLEDIGSCHGEGA